MGYCSDQGSEGHFHEVPQLDIKQLISSSVQNSNGILTKKKAVLQMASTVDDDIIDEESAAGPAHADQESTLPVLPGLIGQGNNASKPDLKCNERKNLMFSECRINYSVQVLS